VGWRHGFGDVRSQVAAGFAGGPSEVFEGAALARDAVAVEAGVSTSVGRSGAFGLSYVGQAGGHVQDHAAKASLTWRF
jgi:outer membrane autotransporter protein